MYARCNGGNLVGHCLRELPQHLRKLDSRVVAIYRKGRSISPEGDTVVEDGDEVFFLAASNDIRRVMNEMRKQDDPVKRIVIAGGGNIGFRLAQGARENQPGEAHRARYASAHAGCRSFSSTPSS